MEEKEYTGAMIHIKIGDKVFSYDLGKDITPDQIRRVGENCMHESEDISTAMWFTYGYAGL